MMTPGFRGVWAGWLDGASSEGRGGVVNVPVPGDARGEAEGEGRPPYELDPGFTFERERLQFLVWANNYDARKPGEPVWWHGVRASRIGATLGGPADVLLPDGTPAWCDGGPRRPVLSPRGATGGGGPASTAVEAGRAQPAAPHRAAVPAQGAGSAEREPEVVHRDSIDAGLLTPARFAEPAADLAPD